MTSGEGLRLLIKLLIDSSSAGRPGLTRRLVDASGQPADRLDAASCPPSPRGSLSQQLGKAMRVGQVREVAAVRPDEVSSVREVRPEPRDVVGRRIVAHHRHVAHAGFTDRRGALADHRIEFLR